MFVFAITVAASVAVAAQTSDTTACGARPEWGIVLEQEGAPHPVRLNGARMPCPP